MLKEVFGRFRVFFISIVTAVASPGKAITIAKKEARSEKRGVRRKIETGLFPFPCCYTRNKHLSLLTDTT